MSAPREVRGNTIDVIPPSMGLSPAPELGERISSFDFFTDANIQIDDMENLEQSLAYVNPFRRKYQDDKGVEMNIQVFEDSGKQGIRQVTIRTVLDEISASTFLWERGKMADKKKSWRNMNHPMMKGSKDEYDRYTDTDTSTRDGCGVGAIRMRIRDLRILDFSINPNSAYSIVVRRHAVLISLDPIRAVVMANQVIIMLPPGGMDNIIGILGGFMDSWSDGGASALANREPPSSSSQQKQGTDEDHNNQEELGNTPTYFEMHVYEAIFTTINTLHAQQYKLLNDEATVVLSYFNQQTAVIVPLLIQERFRSLKNGLTDLITLLASYRRAFITVILPSTSPYMPLHTLPHPSHTYTRSYPLSPPHTPSLTSSFTHPHIPLLSHTLTRPSQKHLTKTHSYIPSLLLLHTISHTPHPHPHTTHRLTPHPFTMD